MDSKDYSEQTENTRLIHGQYCIFRIEPNVRRLYLGNNVIVQDFCTITVGTDAQLIFNDKVFFNNYCSIHCLEKIEIGENTMFGEGCRLYDHNHQYDSAKTEPYRFNTAPIIIGKNCWIGSNCVILKGVTIGDNVIIGAGCIIYKDVPANTVVMAKQEYILKEK